MEAELVEFQPDPGEFCEGEGDQPVAMVEDFPTLDHSCCSNSASTLQATLANEVWQFTNMSIYVLILAFVHSCDQS